AAAINSANLQTELRKLSGLGTATVTVEPGSGAHANQWRVNLPSTSLMLQYAVNGATRADAARDVLDTQGVVTLKAGTTGASFLFGGVSTLVSLAAGQT